MSLTYGFYNSLHGDRKYDAVQFGQIFDGIINDGVFMSIGGKLMVTASAGMKVSVATGRAWFDSTWTYNDSIMLLDVTASEVLLNRVDAVVLEVDATDTVRANSIKIIKGTPATNPVAPTLTNSGKVYQHPLAHVYVAAGATSISTSNITNKVGTSECPFVTGILETMNIDELIQQWGTQWEEFMSGSETEFDTWFNMMKDQLSTDAAGNLQLQINNLKDNLQLQINDLKETVTTGIMLASRWTSDKKYSFESSYPSSKYNIYIALTDTCTDAQYDAWVRAGLIGSSATNIITAHDEKPNVDIPIVIKVVKK